MSQGSPQFTPRQLLDAGLRAEAEGKLDHAIQLYRHLVDHYAYTTEAAEARNGLGRLGVGASQQLWAENGAAAPAAWPGPIATNRPSASRSGGRARFVAAERKYRTGRVLATLVSCVGWLIVALGAAMVPLVLVVDTQTLQGGLPFVLPYVTSLGPVGAVAVAVACSIAGLAVVFWGQMARALFDQANATRELVAIERAKQAEDQD
jgi:hypothetical protein